MIDHNSFVLDTKKPHLYFMKYKYKMQVYTSEIHYFRRAFDTMDVNRIINNYLGWKRNVFYTPDKVNNIKNQALAFVDWRRKIRDSELDCHIRIEYSTAHIYANDFSVFQSLHDELKKFNVQIDYFYVNPIPTYDPAIIYHRNPQYRFRMYFSVQKYSAEDRAELDKCLASYSLYPSKSLASWLANSKNKHYSLYTYDHLHINFNDEQLVTILALKYPNLIRKLCKIEKR